MTIGEQLTQARQANHLTQQEVSAHLHVVRQTVSSWETGRSFPDTASLIALADLYELSLDDLLREGSDMAKHMERKDQLLRETRWAFWLSLILDLVLLGTLIAAMLQLPAFIMGNAIIAVLGSIAVVNAIGLIIVSQRYNRLLTPKPTTPGWLMPTLALFCLIVAGTVLVRVGVTALTLGLTAGLICGWLVVAWQAFAKHNSR